MFQHCIVYIDVQTLIVFMHQFVHMSHAAMVLVEASNEGQWADKNTHILISVILIKIKRISSSGGLNHAATCNSSEYSKVNWTSKFYSLVKVSL